MKRILVVEDDRFFRQLYADLLTREGYEVVTAATGNEALERLVREEFQLVITDLVMPGLSGLDVLTWVKQQAPNVEVILVTGHANLETAIIALKSGARDYLLKPVNEDEFKHSVALCFEQRRLLDENIELKQLVNLFQVGQNIANCLDQEKLHSIVVDALAKEAGVARALGFFRDNEKLVLREMRGVGEDAAARLAEILEAGFLEHPGGQVAYRLMENWGAGSGVIGVAGAEGVRDLLLCYVRSKAGLLSVVALFNDVEAVFPADINYKNLVFLLDQSSLAIENALRYSTARTMLYVDELTGLFNYRYLDISLEREIKRADRFGTNVSLIFIDLDYFKNINDTHGHLVGSGVLKEVGLLLKESVREVDIVIRYGGDEFTIILVETAEKGAATVAERIRRSIEAHRFQAEAGLDINITACLGYACYPVDTLSRQELLDLADKAMYRGKSGGKNTVFRATLGQ